MASIGEPSRVLASSAATNVSPSSNSMENPSTSPRFDKTPLTTPGNATDLASSILLFGSASTLSLTPPIRKGFAAETPSELKNLIQIRSVAKSSGIATLNWPSSSPICTSTPGAKTLGGQSNFPWHLTFTSCPRCPPAGNRYSRLGAAENATELMVKSQLVTNRNPRCQISVICFSTTTYIISRIGRGSLTKWVGRPELL